MARLRSLFTDMKQTFRSSGFRGLLRIYGWKFVAGIFVYYLIRDLILYLLLPWLLLGKLFSFPTPI